MRRILSPIVVVLILLATACTETRADRPAGEKPTLGKYTEEGAFSPFYGEVLHEKRIYLFGTKRSYDQFMARMEVDPNKARMLIGKGPGKETVVVELDKESPQMTKRVLNQFKGRYGLTWDA